MSSRFSAFPTEIYVMITNEVFNSPTPSRTTRYHVDSSLHLALRSQRLGWLRSLASVSKAWVYPVRTAFWKEVTLFTIRDLVAFARAIEDSDTTAKPACIRRFYLRFMNVTLAPGTDLLLVAEEVRRSLIVILRRLSAHLDVLHFNFENRHSLLSDMVFRSLHAASQDGTCSIDVTKLDIQSPSSVFPVITFVRNVVHLVLAVDCHMTELITSIPSIRLETLVLLMNFSGSTRFAPGARNITNVLGPACETLQSLTLVVYGYNAWSKEALTEAMKYVLSLKSPSTSVLNLRAKPFYPLPAAQGLADSDVFSPYPTLQYLHLDEIGVCPDIFRQLSCYGLRRLHVTLRKTKTPSARDWVETIEDILSSIKLKELDNLEDLVIDFSSATGYDEDMAFRATVGCWTDNEPSWEPLERACAARSIACTVRYPE